MSSLEMNSPGMSSPVNNTTSTALTLTPPPTSQSIGQAHLRFQLTEALTCAFSMDEIHEVVVISPAQLTPIFNMPACVRGLLTRHSRILWTVDLAALLFDADTAKVGPSSAGPSRTGPSSAGRYSIVIVRVNATGPASTPFFISSPPEKQPPEKQPPENQLLLGLLVQNIRGYIQLDPASIQPPEAQPAAAQPADAPSSETQAFGQPIVSGLWPYLRGSVLDGDTPLHVLDVEAIASRLKQKTVDGAPPDPPSLET